jgi:uncharacterized protein YbjT (DUF2867 family)
MTALGPILVTGASGCVGRAVTARLLSEGYEVRAVRRRASQPPSPLNQRPNLTWIDADLLYAWSIAPISAMLPITLRRTSK